MPSGNFLLLSARVLLASVLAVAGVAKLRDPKGLSRAFRDFGGPPGAAPAAARVIPSLELAIAAALIPIQTAPYAAIAASALLAAFAMVVAVSLAHGRKPSCNCFGQIRSAPIGRQTFVRNVVLALAAAIVAVWSTADGGTLVFGRTPAEVLVAAVGMTLLLAETAMLLTVSRENAALHQNAAARGSSHDASDTTLPNHPRAKRPHATSQLLQGSPAPAFELRTGDGTTVSLEALRRLGKPVALIFSDPDCGPCRALMAIVRDWQAVHADNLTIAVISRPAPAAAASPSPEYGLRYFLLQRRREVANAYGVVGTPSGVIVQADGTIASAVVSGEPEIAKLVAEWSGKERPALAASRPAPAFTLAGLDGHDVSLQHSLGKPTLVLFWNPKCGFCRKMLPDLRSWESRPVAERAALVVVSSGSVDENRALGLRSAIGLDQSSTVAREYGFTGTPSAALVDASGRLLEKVVGASDILSLIGQPESGAVMPIVSLLPDSADTSGPVAHTAAVELAGGARPLKHHCVQDELLSDGSMVLYNSCRKRVLTLNATGALVWDYCDGEHSVDDIAAEVRQLFANAANVAQDVRDVLNELLRASMIAPARDSAARDSSASPVS